LSSEEEKRNVFAYFGPSDLRYFCFVVAAMKTGRHVSCGIMHKEGLDANEGNNRFYLRH